MKLFREGIEKTVTILRKATREEGYGRGFGVGQQQTPFGTRTEIVHKSLLRK
ncbi:MAG: hypothetical protein ABIJ85_02310 [bacterium]